MEKLILLKHVAIVSRLDHHRDNRDVSGETDTQSPQINQNVMKQVAWDGVGCG